jgi:ADP-heptose:LPS heptosyltransferase
VISNDTGPLHLARAAGAPTVGIYTGFNLIGYGPLTRELHRVAVSWRTERARCGPDCPGDFCERCEPFVADIEAGEVMEKALDLLCGNAGTGWEG